MKKSPLRILQVSESEVSVQGHGVHTAYEEMIAALQREPGVEVLRGFRDVPTDISVVHIHTIGPRVWRWLLNKNVKKVISAHVVPDSFIGSIVLARYWRFAARWYMKWVYNKADIVLAVSGMVATALQDELGVSKEKIIVQYNTINMGDYTPERGEKARLRQELAIPADAFVVFGAGQVQPRKRLDTFAAMARELPDVWFIWSGGIPFKRLGADYAAMQALTASLPGNMKITGIIPHDDIKKYLKAADVFCLPAEQENHPMCVLEAAGAGLPIILRDIPEYDDTFMQDPIRASSDAEFSAAAARLRDDAAYRKNYLDGSRRIAQRFDSAAMAAKIAALYRRITVAHTDNI